MYKLYVFMFENESFSNDSINTIVNVQQQARKYG